jgi:protein-disulfide isomerase
VERQVEENYVNTGKVRFGYFQFPFLGDESHTAAQASECASDQGKFWEYHDYLFSHQNGENQGAFSADNLKKFAQEMGLDTQAFNQCLDSGKYKDVVDAQAQFARQLGVQSTPSFLINGTPMVGAQSYEAFQQLFDQFLKK